MNGWPLEYNMPTQRTQKRSIVFGLLLLLFLLFRYEENAKEDVEKSTECGKRENRKEKEAPDDNNPLGRVRLLFVWIGLLFAVFLYSLGSLS